jgi:hypothetical protein
VSQCKYIKDMFKKFDMNESKAISIWMGTNGNLDSDACGNMVDQKLYRSMIGSLLYVTASKSDVMFSVCMSACVQDFKPHQEKFIWRLQREYWGS